jgi:hypothetical protein
MSEAPLYSCPAGLEGCVFNFLWQAKRERLTHLKDFELSDKTIMQS